MVFVRFWGQKNKSGVTHPQTPCDYLLVHNFSYVVNYTDCTNTPMQSAEQEFEVGRNQLYHSTPGFSIDLNFQDVMTSKLKNLDVSVQNLEVMQLPVGLPENSSKKLT